MHLLTLNKHSTHFWREGLWKKLKDYHITGKCHTLIKNMYNNIKSKISTHNGTTDYFPCTIGVRQGENLSPFLFSIYLNDLEHYLNSHQVTGIICDAEGEQLRTYLKLFILLFADDTVLLSENKTDLQNALNIFESFCGEWKLTVNIEKTKVLVFGRGKQPKNETFTYKDKPLATTNEYKYLGIVLSRSGSFKNAIKHITEQANKAMFSLLKKIRILNLPIELQIDLFNKMVKPVLLYGCKLWGLVTQNHLKEFS